MTDRLTVYNGALRLLGDERVASLSEPRKPRRVLDQAWADGAVNYCLEAGQWKFATRAVQLDASPSVAPGFGTAYFFEVPADHRRLVGVYSDDTLTTPYRDYREEGAHWVAGIATIYVRYVSSDAAWGGDLARWPARFTKYVEAHLASEVALSITGDKGRRDDMIALRDKKELPQALSNDAMQEPTTLPLAGNWVRARMGGRGYARRDGQP